MQSTIITLGLFVLFSVVMILVRKKIGKKASSNFDKTISSILADAIPNGENVNLTSYGLDKESVNRGSSAAFMESSLNKTSTGEYKYYDYYIVALTDQNIYFIPAKYQGKLATKLTRDENRPVDVHPLGSISKELGEVNNGSAVSVPFVDVKFTLPDGKTKDIQFYQNLEKWKQI